MIKRERPFLRPVIFSKSRKNREKFTGKYPYILFFLLLITALLNCGKDNRHKKIAIFQKPFEERTNIGKKTVTSLTPEKFVEITLKIKDLTDKIDNIESEDTSTNLDIAHEQKIAEIYRKYNITEEEFNSYGGEHYKEIQDYLAQHPEYSDKMK